MKPAIWPTPSQRQTLQIIHGNPGLSFQDLADLLGGLDWTSARERVQRLERSGLVARMRGRQRSFTLTLKGVFYVSENSNTVANLRRQV